MISHLIAPVIIHYAIADAPLALLHGGLVFLFFDDHVPLGKIAYDTRAWFKGWYRRMGDGLQIPCMMQYNFRLLRLSAMGQLRHMGHWDIHFVIPKKQL